MNNRYKHIHVETEYDRARKWIATKRESGVSKQDLKKNVEKSLSKLLNKNTLTQEEIKKYKFLSKVNMFLE